MRSEASASVEREGPTEPADGRKSPREPFLCVQMIGVAEKADLPSADSFHEITCENVSRGGIAFYLDHVPEFDQCVIALGRPPELTYLLARVAHVDPVYRVGCQFLRKLTVNPATGQLLDLDTPDQLAGLDQADESSDRPT